MLSRRRLRDAIDLTSLLLGVGRNLLIILAAGYALTLGPLIRPPLAPTGAACAILVLVLWARWRFCRSAAYLRWYVAASGEGATSEENSHAAPLLAAAYVRARRFDEADRLAGAYESAIAEDRSFPHNIDHCIVSGERVLAAAYWSAGRQDWAAFMYQHALAHAVQVYHRYRDRDIASVGAAVIRKTLTACRRRLRAGTPRPSPHWQPVIGAYQDAANTLAYHYQRTGQLTRRRRVRQNTLTLASRLLGPDDQAVQAARASLANTSRPNIH